MSFQDKLSDITLVMLLDISLQSNMRMEGDFILLPGKASSIADPIPHGPIAHEVCITSMGGLDCWSDKCKGGTWKRAININDYQFHSVPSACLATASASNLEAEKGCGWERSC